VPPARRPPEAKIQFPNFVRVSRRCAKATSASAQMISIGMPSTTGSPARVPRSKTSIISMSASQSKTKPKILPPKTGASQSPSAASSMPPMMVLTFDQLREEDGEAAQDEQEGQRHDEAWQPRAHHDEAVERADGDAQREGQKDRDPDRPLQRDREDGDHMPAKPIIEPTDRSNSPAIISMQAPTAMIMNCAETVDQFRMPCALNMPLSPAKAKKKTNTIDGADDGAQFRPDQGLAKSRDFLDAFVFRRGVARIPLSCLT
jgi:hypothetical protein